MERGWRELKEVVPLLSVKLIQLTTVPAVSLFMSIEISDIYGRTSTSTRMPGKSLLRNGLKQEVATLLHGTARLKPRGACANFNHSNGALARPASARMTSCEPHRSSAYGEDLRWRMVWQTEALYRAVATIGAGGAVAPPENY